MSEPRASGFPRESTWARPGTDCSPPPHLPPAPAARCCWSSIRSTVGARSATSSTWPSRWRGWPVRVACSAGGVRAGALADAGVEVSVLVRELVKRRVSPRYGQALRRLVHEHRPAVVHAHLYASAAAAVQATRGLEVPVVLTEHTEGPWRGPGARLVSRLVYRRVGHVWRSPRPSG